MTAYWKRIIQRQFDAGNITAAEVSSYVTSRITQAEADDILNAT